MTTKLRSLWLPLILTVGYVRTGVAQETHRLSGPAVAVYDVVGRVEVVRGSGADVVVRVTRGGSDASQLEVEVGEVAGRQTLRVIFPEGDIVYPRMGAGSNTSVSLRADGTFGGDNGRGSRVRVRGSGTGLEAWADLVIEVPVGRDVDVNLAVGEADVRGVDGDISLDVGSGPVVVEDVAGTLDVDTGSGSVRAARITATLGIETGSGSVDVSELSGSEVSVGTGSGRVTALGVRTSVLSVDTGSGSVQLDQITAPDVSVDTGSGSVELELLVDVDRLIVETGSGSITVSAPANLGGTVDLQTSSGGIDVDFPVEVRSVRRNQLRGQLGDGAGTIRIDTGSGSVRLVRR